MSNRHPSVGSSLTLFGFGLALISPVCWPLFGLQVFSIVLSIAALIIAVGNVLMQNKEENN